MKKNEPVKKRPRTVEKFTAEDFYSILLSIETGIGKTNRLLTRLLALAEQNARSKPAG